MPKVATASEVEAAEALVRKSFDLALAGRKEEYLALFTNDGVIEIPFNESGRTDDGFYRVYSGSEALRRFVEESTSAESSIAMYDEVFTTSADAKVTFLECRGDVAMANGRSYRNRSVLKYELRDGKIARLKEYYNPIVSAIAFGRKITGKIVIDAPAEEGMLVGGLAK
jgi:ketosteroid isomerase-like protein